MNLRKKIGLPYALFGLVLLAFFVANYYFINYRYAEIVERKSSVERIHGNIHMIGEKAANSILTSDAGYLVRAAQASLEVHDLLAALKEVDSSLSETISDDFVDFYVHTIALSTLFLEGRKQERAAMLEELEQLQQRIYGDLHAHMQELDDGYAATTRLNNLLIMSTIGAFGFVFILVLFYVVPRHILKPLQGPIKFAKEVARGNLQAIPPSSISKDEVGTLSTALGEMHSTYMITNSLLSLSLEDEPLEVLMKKAIDQILSISWLDGQGRGAIFLCEEPGVLTMKAERGLAEPVKEACSSIPFGFCICGRTALSGEPHHASDLAENHEVTHNGIIPHGHYCIPIKSSDKVIGVLNIYTKPGIPRNDRQESFLTGIANLLAGIIERKQTKEALQKSAEQRAHMVENAVEALASLVELRDPYTAGHQRRVAKLSLAVAERLGFDRDRAAALRLAALVHDVGKIQIPTEILNKPGKLNNLEMRLIREHPTSARNLFEGVEFAWPLAEIIYQHHERLDGSGYPQGLSGNEILLEARIMAVADVVEAISSHRPYRPSLGLEAALAEIEKNAGRLYDPDIVDICLKLLREEGFTFEE